MATPTPDLLNKPVFGQLILVSDPSSPLPLEKTEVASQITGLLAVVSVTQYFSNPFKDTVELEYLFPLPHDAAITGFEFKISNRTITGKLEETEKAAEEYNQAVSAGKRAALVDQRRENLFAIKLGNIRPGDSIQAVIHYQNPIDFNDGICEFVFPMGLTPRFQRPEDLESAPVNPPIADSDEKIGPVQITISVDSGFATANPTSPSHELQVNRLDDRRFLITLPQATLPDHDFILRYSVPAGNPVLPAWRSTHSAGDTFLAFLMPPPLADLDLQPAPREFVFVLDRSGSMSGEPIAQARNALRACLRSLNPEDTFAILLFDDMIDWFQKEPLAVTQENIDLADRFLARVDGRGGTDIIPAVQAALDLPADSGRMRFVVFLTDGAVSAEEKTLAEVRKHLKNARIFTFGIGPSVNRMLLERLSQYGRGASEFLLLDENIEDAIIRFQDRVSFPVLTDLHLAADKVKTWDTYPSILPDLYAGQSICLTGRILARNNQMPTLTLQGKRAGETVEIKVELPENAAEAVSIQRAWARARVDDLILQSMVSQKPTHQVRSEIIALALEFQLITPYTSFIAVEDKVEVSSGKTQKIWVSQPLPKGLDPAGFFGGVAQLNKMSPPSPSSSPGLFRSMAQSAMLSSILPASTGASYMAEETAPFQPQDLNARTSSEDGLHWLARTQKLEGSWDGDVEKTSAALMAFVKNGHTTHAGHYRKQIQRAFAWLSKMVSQGFPSFARALALQQLAAATGLSEQLDTARAAAEALDPPGDDLEKAYLSAIQGKIETPKLPSKPLPTEIHSLDDLRLSALLPAQASPYSGDQKQQAGSGPQLAQYWQIILE